MSEADSMARRLAILQELAPYELGVGWPCRPGEKSLCKKLVAEGKLVKRGRAYEISPAGRAFVEAVA